MNDATAAQRCANNESAPSSRDNGYDWRHRATCRDEDPELFFAAGTSGPALLQIAEAKSVCRRCPVATECLTWATAPETWQDAGVWGGLSEDERRASRRHHTRHVCSTRLARSQAGDPS